MFRQYSVLLISLALTACSKPLPEFEKLDLATWQNDKNACGEYRSGTLETFQSQKEKLLALNESQIIELLGRPDQNELYKRNQKFFYYYLKPSSACPQPSTEPRRLAIRFNAMGLAKEVAVE